MIADTNGKRTHTFLAHDLTTSCRWLRVANLGRGFFIYPTKAFELGAKFEVWVAKAYGLVARAVVVFDDHDVLDHVAHVTHVHELGERHAAGIRQLNIGIEREEGGEHVREAKAAVDAATHRGGIAQLHAHNVVDGNQTHC